MTPVFKASAAGIEDRPGWMAPVNIGAFPMGQGHCPPAGGGLPPPHQHPGGAFCHWVTTAVATDVHGAAAVTVV